MKDFFAGARYLISGFSLLTKPGVRAYVAIPLLINVALFSVLVWWAYGWVGVLTDRLLSYLPNWLHGLTVSTASNLCSYGIGVNILRVFDTGESNRCAV